MPRITQECAARIKDSADIVETIGRYLQLRRAGNAWKACCPFHNEKTPSFHVNPARQTFHCFGCGVGGDAIKFLMMYENLDYPTALRRMADMNGVPVIEEEENPEAAKLRRLRSAVIATNRLATDYFHRKLCRAKEADHARLYLKQRGFNIEIAKAWELGWAPENFREFSQLAARQGIDAQLLSAAYLLGKGSSGSYPVFRDRLMFPIRNVRGEVVGFSGRIMRKEQDPRKYVNTSETVAFHKGELLFGLNKATSAIGKADMTVIVCEGQLDVIACHEKADVRNTVAGLGTAFTDEHAKMLAKYAKKAILCYDGDSAGIKASEKTFRKLAAAGLDVYYATLPAGEDPDSLINTQGAEALRRALDAAQPYLETRAAIELQRAREDANARAALIPRMADMAADIKDPNRRDVAVADLATRLNTGLETLRATVADILRNRRAPAHSPHAPSPCDEQEIDGGEEPQDTQQTSVVPLRLHATIRNLISLAASNLPIQQMIADRIEELQEPIKKLPGGPVLQRFMEILPTPGSAESWRQFMEQLRPEQAAALHDFTPHLLNIETPASYVEQALDRAARDTIKQDIDQLRSEIRRNDISPEKAALLMKQCNELQKLLSH